MGPWSHVLSNDFGPLRGLHNRGQYGTSIPSRFISADGKTLMLHDHISCRSPDAVFATPGCRRKDTAMRIMQTIWAAFYTSRRAIQSSVVLSLILLLLAHPVGLAQNGTWATKAPMPTARQVLGVGVVNGKLYAVGGTTSVTSSGSDFSVVEVYDPVTDTWSTKAPMPTPRHGLAVAVINGVLYAVGGYSFNTCNCDLSTLEAYDPVSNTWSTKAPMPTAREGLVVGAINGVLYAVGGSLNGSNLSSVEAYNPVSNTWSTKAPMPTPTTGPAGDVVDGIFYVAGGANSSGSLSTLQAYDPATDSWLTKTSMPTPHYLLGAGVANEIFYALGGYQNIATVEAYDPRTDSWTGAPSMPTGRIPGAGVVNGVLYAVGGYDYNAGTALGTNEAFTPIAPGTAMLAGGNTFSGNQTVNGAVSATSFTGSGMGLTGVNAVTLGGIPSLSYARVDVGNSFTGNQSISGNLSTAGSTILGGGTPIVEHLSALFNPSIAALKPATCATANFTLTGASDGDTLALGVPNARMTGGTGVILNYFAWVSATNTVTIQVCNVGGSPQKTAGTGAIRVDVWKH